jgi:tetratricopeptide (TPR) repeat protein
MQRMWSGIHSRFRQERAYAVKKCLELNPEVSAREVAYYNLGRTYLRLSRHEEAIGALNQSLRLNSQDPETHFYLGVTYRKYAIALLSFGQQPRRLNLDRD